VPAHLFVEDTSFADAPAKLLGHVTLPVVLDADRTMHFTIYDLEPNENAAYTLRVLVDLDRDTQASAGDYVTTQSIPVLTGGHPSDVTVTVHLLQV
jgi:hypothetical protein